MGLGKFVFIVGVVVNFGGCTANVTVSHILHKLKCGYYNYSVEIYFEFCSDKRLRYLHRQILHIFASFLVVVLWILSICHYIDSIPQFLRN